MKRLLFSLQIALVALLVAGAPTRAVAQSDMDLQPGIVISMTSLNEHLSDIEHLMDAAGMGQMSGLVRMGSAEYIRGIDAEKPIGALLFFNDDNPEKPDVLGFLPVTDIEDVLDTLAPFVDIEEAGDDIVLTTNDGTEITVRVSNGYAFVAQNPDMLGNLPENPANLLEQLPSDYNIAARVFGQRVPESLRTQAIDLIKSGAEAEMENLGDGPEAELQRSNFAYSMAQMESFINDTEEVVVGLAIDEDEKRILIDFKVVGLDGSQLAKQSNAMAEAPTSQFGGFLIEDASANLHVCAKLLEEDLEQMKTMIDNLVETAEAQIDKEEMSDDESAAAKRVLGDLMNVLRESVSKGYLDMGGSMMLSDEDAELALGLSIAEGGKLEASVKELAKWADKEGAPVEFNFDVGAENGVRYHEVNLMIPEDEEEVRDIFGGKVKILLGVGDDVLYIAAGKSPKELLTKCINGSAPATEEGVIGQFNMHLLPILKFASKFQDAGELAGIADALPESAEDRMRMTVRSIQNGQHYRFEIEDAVLKVFVSIGQSMGGGFGGPAQDF